MDKVVHFEITFDDQERAKDFYRSVFDWQLHDNDMGNGVSYTTAMTVPIDDKMRPTEPGAINGGFTGKSKETPSPVITIGVSSIDDTLKKVEASGGKGGTPPTPIPHKGALPRFTRHEGNTTGAFAASWAWGG